MIVYANINFMYKSLSNICMMKTLSMYTKSLHATVQMPNQMNSCGFSL